MSLDWKTVTFGVIRLPPLAAALVGRRCAPLHPGAKGRRRETVGSLIGVDSPGEKKVNCPSSAVHFFSKRRTSMEKPSKSAAGLKELINHAISDLEITPDEYNKIMEHAHADGHLDKEEQGLLAQFHQMLNNGTIKRVRG
jgi:hypothetical protein